ncbi:DUF4347 domain-containing protein [Vogesella fluminis]|uniref:DUF4347 domain-containing protein n=2 Tax=Bacteria TaxID=2 RepID=A0ABQ3HBP3_9NEIS|nr:DUF4347 domain-containing protein [Vogesella fluminis]GHD79421.1 hypothetical protein GCM10011419_22840 [Vogesella fluminis]
MNETVRHDLPQATDRLELVVIDRSISNWEVLADSVAPGYQVLLLSDGGNGLAELAAWCVTHSGYDAIHIFSHGSAGQLNLGSDNISAASLHDSTQSAQLRTLGDALDPEGDLLLYACSLAADEAARTFIADLAQLTSTDIAASSDLTGNAASGGNWLLEATTGSVINTRFPLIPEKAELFSGALVNATLTFEAGTGSLSGDGTDTITYAHTDSNSTFTFTTKDVNNNTGILKNGSSYGAPTGRHDDESIYTESSGKATSLTVTIGGGKVFDLISFYLSNQNATGDQTFTVTTSKGGSTTGTAGFSGPIDTDKITLPDTDDFKGITWFTITAPNGGAFMELDDIELTNIITPASAPTTTVSSTSLSADTGSSSSDFITQTASQTISGTLSTNLATGEKVEVSFDNGSSWSDASSFSVGSSSWSTTTTLSGSNTFQARVTNSGGSSTAYSKAYVLDSSAPAISAPDMTSGTDSGSSSSDNLTSDNTPTFTGTAEAGASVTLYDSDGSTSLGNVTADGSGNWSITASTLSEGSHTLTAKATDSAGNTSNASASLAVSIDNTAPTVTSVSSATANGSYKTGDVIAITVQFSEAVTVTGTPQLTLETGSTDRVVNYASGSGTSTLTFNYTVQAGDTSADLDYASTAALALNGGTIKDAAGNNATLTLATPGAADSLGANKAIVIDGVAPTVTSVSASTADGAYHTGDTVTITVTFNEAVTVDTSGGTPRLKLETGTTDQYAGYVSGSGSNTLTFSYTVQAGDTSTDLDYTATNALELNSGTIRDAAGNHATLTLASPGAAGSLGANKALLINPPPTITSATYDADSGELVVTAVGLIAASGAANDIVTNKFTLTGEGGNTYTLTDTANVEISSATSFTLTLSATDKAAANLILNKNGTSSASGTTFNLAAAEDWAAGADASLVVADLTGNDVTASNVATPAITSATYDYASNTLVVTGTGFVSKAGASNDIDISKLTITGQGGASYTLTSASDVEITSGTSFSITLSGSDLVNVKALLNKNGTTAHDSTSFNLAVAEDWAAGADAAIVIADTTGNGITVTNWAAPVISSTSFDWATGQLVLTGSDFVPASGTANDVIASKFTFTGEGGNTYTLSDSSNIEIGSDSSATLTLSATDLMAVRGLLSKNGALSADSTTYNLSAADDWMAASPATGNIADASTGITVSNVGTPSITDASYDADTGILSVTSSNLFRKTGAGNDVDISTLTLTGGTANATYTLTSASDVEITSATSFSITLSGADKAAVDTLLDQLGTQSTGGSIYNLAAADNWLAGADSATDINDATNAVTVSVNPKLSSASYDASTGTLVVTGSSLQANGSGADIDTSKLTLTGEGGVTYTLTDTSDVEITSATGFTLTLSATDRAAANLILNKNGTSSTGGTTFNLAAADDWNTQITAGDTADSTNGLTVSNVAVPAITSATYHAATGTLVVTGTGLLKRDGSTNDIVASKFTLTGEGGSTYTLTDSANVEISSGTGFTLTLSATDKAAANLILNKNGTSSTSGTTFNLAAAEDWAAGADAAVVIADLSGNGITVSNVTAPAISSATYNESSGVLTVTGTGFLKRDGAANDIDVGKLKISGDSTEYTLTSANVDITSATSFSITLNATDKTALASRLNKDGTSSTSNATYNLAAVEDWAQGADAAVTVADLTGNGITVTLTPPAPPLPPPTTSPDDKDGVSEMVENAVPAVPDSKGNTVIGDGNGDGHTDSTQANVSSVAFLNTTTAQSNPGAAKPVYVTLVADSDSGKTGATATAALSDVKQLDKPADAPADLTMPLGLIAFKADAGSAGASKNFSLYVDSSISVNGYWKKLGSDWVNLASEQYGGKLITEGGKTRLDFSIEDGGQFDNDGKADGVITDPGAIGFRAGSSSDSDNDQFPDALEAANGLQVGVKDNDVFGSSRLFVMQLYRDTLFREADPDGLVAWQKQLDSGAMNRAQITSAFLDSAEFQAGAGAITRLYLGALDRQPDQARLDYWVAQWQDGTSLQQISASFLDSMEFKDRHTGTDNAAFIDLMYNQILDRTGESAGVQAWKAQLDAGMARSQALLGFTESTEYRALSDQQVNLGIDYLGLLNREPDSVGYAHWLGRIQQNMPEVDIIGHFMAVQEYHDRFLP